MPKYYTCDSSHKYGYGEARLPRLIFLKLPCWKQKHSKYTKEEGPVFGAYAYTCDDADYGEMILVHDGTYIENINFKGKVITLFFENEPATTIIDGSAGCGVVTFDNGENKISHFTS